MAYICRYSSKLEDGFVIVLHALAKQFISILTKLKAHVD
jgi:hypothetical protein